MICIKVRLRLVGSGALPYFTVANMEREEVLNVEAPFITVDKI